MSPEKKFITFTYAQASLFSLRSSEATSKVSKSYLCPTPHCVKCAMISKFAESHSEGELFSFFKDIRNVPILFKLPQHLVVNQNFYTQLKKSRDTSVCFDSTIMYKEYVHYNDDFQVIIDISRITIENVNKIIDVMMKIEYFGKKDSFITYKSHEEITMLPEKLIQPVDEENDIFGMVVSLDDLFIDVKEKDLKKYLQNLRELGGFGSQRKRTQIPYYFPYELVSSSKQYTHYQMI